MRIRRRSGAGFKGDFGAAGSVSDDRSVFRTSCLLLAYSASAACPLPARATEVAGVLSISEVLQLPQNGLPRLVIVFGRIDMVAGAAMLADAVDAPSGQQLSFSIHLASSSQKQRLPRAPPPPAAASPAAR